MLNVLEKKKNKKTEQFWLLAFWKKTMETHTKRWKEDLLSTGHYRNGECFRAGPLFKQQTVIQSTNKWWRRWNNFQMVHLQKNLQKNQGPSAGEPVESKSFPFLHYVDLQFIAWKGVSENIMFRITFLAAMRFPHRHHSEKIKQPSWVKLVFTHFLKHTRA